MAPARADATGPELASPGMGGRAGVSRGGSVDAALQTAAAGAAPFTTAGCVAGGGAASGCCRKACIIDGLQQSSHCESVCRADAARSAPTRTFDVTCHQAMESHMTATPNTVLTEPRLQFTAAHS